MEREQFIQAIVPYREKLIHYARLLLKENAEAEDVVQEVFLKLWCVRDQLDRYRSLYALCIQVTKNLALNRLKVQQYYTDLPAGGLALASDAPAPDSRLEQQEEDEQVMRLIDRLPCLQQTILRMTHLEGLETAEIAALTGSTPEAVRMNLSRARKRIRELLLQQQIG